MGSTPSPPPPPPPSLSLSATAPVFRPSFPSRSSTPSLSSSLLFLPTGAAASTSTAAFPATRRHSDYPSSSSSSSSSPLPPPQLSFKTPQLGSAALWDPQDDDVSLGPNSIHGRRDSTWGSPLSFLSDLSTTTSAPNTPADGGRRPSLSSFSPESVPVERRFPEDQTVQAMAAKIAELSLQLSSSLSQLDELRAENLTLRAQHAPGGPLPPPPNLSRRGSVALSPVISRDDRCTMDAVYNGVAPPVQALPGGLIRPPPEIAQDILLGTMDYRDFFALPGLHLAPPPISVEVFTIRVQWVVAVLAGEYPAKEGALKRAASALTDILNSEKRFSRRVVALLNVLATAASALAVRPQGNFLIQNAFGCGREARQAFFEIMRPDFKTIIPAQYGQHVVLKMIVRDDMRALIVDCLVELLGDREFLQTRGGTRVLEQALKSFSRDQCRFVYDKSVASLFSPRSFLLR
ncbi:hypothetical protein BDY24DRAFT_156881 [Mrakia frigida]|uniref:uncharacterized protein n=1 Tax=Mrakia frigida TaxID=29902 RepID=UPI003FCC0A82